MMSLHPRPSQMPLVLVAVLSLALIQFTPPGCGSRHERRRPAPVGTRPSSGSSGFDHIDMYQLVMARATSGSTGLGRCCPGRA